MSDEHSYFEAKTAEISNQMFTGIMYDNPDMIYNFLIQGSEYFLHEIVLDVETEIDNQIDWSIILERNFVHSSDLGSFESMKVFHSFSPMHEKILTDALQRACELSCRKHVSLDYVYSSSRSSYSKTIGKRKLDNNKAQIEWLLDHGADPNRENELDDFPISLQQQCEFGSIIQTLLWHQNLIGLTVFKNRKIKATLQDIRYWCVLAEHRYQFELFQQVSLVFFQIIDESDMWWLMMQLAKQNETDYIMILMAYYPLEKQTKKFWCELYRANSSYLMRQWIVNQVNISHGEFENWLKENSRKKRKIS